jgi:hypothetical protein
MELSVLSQDSIEQLDEIDDQWRVRTCGLPLENSSQDFRRFPVGHPPLDDTCIEVNNPILRDACSEIKITLHDAIGPDTAR